MSAHGPPRVHTHDGPLAEAVGALATQALRQELDLTPKPGLVDRVNSGAHHDMNHATFVASVAAVAPWFARFTRSGYCGAMQAAAPMLSQLRQEGLACEQEMLAATGGVNTHKGSVFSLGLLCAAAGRLHARGLGLTAPAVCEAVARLCVGVVERDLGSPTASPTGTAGERLFRQHGLAGARGEASSGFATARRHGLAPYLQAKALNCSRERALMESLLHLMAHNADTNLVARGGLPGLHFVQSEARRLLALPWPTTAERKVQLEQFDLRLIERRLSPGGSADLLAVTWFLAHLVELTHLTDPVHRAGLPQRPDNRHRHDGQTPAPPAQRPAASHSLTL